MSKINSPQIVVRLQRHQMNYSVLLQDKATAWLLQYVLYLNPIVQYVH